MQPKNHFYLALKMLKKHREFRKMAYVAFESRFLNISMAVSLNSYKNPVIVCVAYRVDTVYVLMYPYTQTVLLHLLGMVDLSLHIYVCAHASAGHRSCDKLTNHSMLSNLY